MNRSSGKIFWFFFFEHFQFLSGFCGLFERFKNALGPEFSKEAHRLIYFSCYSLHSLHSTFLAVFSSFSVIFFVLLPFCVYCLFKMIWAIFYFCDIFTRVPYHIHSSISSECYWIQKEQTNSENKVCVEFSVFHQIKILLHI